MSEEAADVHSTVCVDLLRTEKAIFSDGARSYCLCVEHVEHVRWTETVSSEVMQMESENAGVHLAV